MPCCINCSLGPIINTELIKDMNDMAFNRVWANVQKIGNLRVRGTLHHEAEHFELPAGKGGRQCIIPAFQRQLGLLNQIGKSLFQFFDCFLLFFKLPLAGRGINLNGNG